MFRINPDFIGVFCCPNTGILGCIFVDIKRLFLLCVAKGVSAREMSLDTGQSPSYVNNIENAKNYPSMTVFFELCDYLSITPQQFFSTDVKNPSKIDELLSFVRPLDDEKIELLIACRCSCSLFSIFITCSCYYHLLYQKRPRSATFFDRLRHLYHADAFF